MKRIKGVIFDMDGVLIDAREWHYEALNKALSLFGIEINRYDQLLTFDGLPTKKKLQMLTLERGLPEELHDFINDLKQQYTLEIVYSRCKPVFHHQYALSHLKLEGYRLALCSNSIRQTIDMMMGKAELMSFMDFSLSNQDVEATKPDPEIYLVAISKLGLKPDECLIVEDNENGIKAAKASGAHLLVVSNPEDVTYANIAARIKQIENKND